MKKHSSLQYLVFDLLDADDTSHTWEAMASVAPARVPAVLAEAVGLVAWAQAEFGTEPLALDESGEWDAWLQIQSDQAQPMTLKWPTHGHPTPPLPFPPGTQWVVVTLTLVAAAPLADAVQQHLDAVSAV